VVFTSGGTEADNLAIKGLYWQRNGEDQARRVIISSAVEHHAVLDTVEWLGTQGAEILMIPVDRSGALDLAWLRATLAERHGEVALIALMLANNETGVISPIAEVAALAAEYEIPVHSDAVAAFGHIAVNFAELGVATLAISGHKIGAPVGIGALIVGRKVKLKPLQQGGGQERALRPGTMNAAGAKAFAKAAELALAELDVETARLSRLRDELSGDIKAAIGEVLVTAETAARVPGTLHLRLPECSSDSLLFLLDQREVALSAGSACSAGVTGVSHVLLGMGFAESESTGSLRITLGYNSSEADCKALLGALAPAYEAAKRAS
jgi:cysteine desulfurase